MTRKKPPATHEQIDKMNVTALRAVLPLLGAPKADRKMLKPALVTWAHEYLSLGWPDLDRVEKEATNVDEEIIALGGEPNPEDGTDPEPAPLDVSEKIAAAEEAGTDLEVAPTDIIPTPSRWQQILDVASTVARANVTPAALRGKPADCAVVLLAANDLGIPITQALQKIGVIDGKMVMAAELMTALIRRDGHTLSIDAASDHTGCTVHGRRVDTGEVMAATFTLQDAKVAELIQSIGDDGYPIARSKEGHPMPWQKYPADLCYARAVSRLARRLFSDVLGGVSYTPEELGDTGDYDAGASFGSPSPAQQHDEATVTIERQRQELHARIAELPEDVATALKAEWKRRNLPNWSKLSPAALRTARSLVEDAEASVPDDVELVDDQGKTLDEQADAAVERDDIDEAEVVPDRPLTTEEATAMFTATDEARAVTDTCAVCTLPIAPGLVDDGTGEMVEQPVVVDGKAYHAECAPM